MSPQASLASQITGWRKCKFGDLVSLRRGHDLTWRERRSGPVPIMGSAGINGFHNEAISPGPGVVLGRSGASFGQAHYIDSDFWPHNTTLYVTDFHGNDPRYIYYLFSSIDFSGHNSGGAQQSLNRNFIAPITIHVPEKREQECIVEVLDDTVNQIENLERVIIKKQAIKQGITQQLLTGKARLPGFDEPWKTTTLGALGIFQKGRGINRNDIRSTGIRCIRYGEIYTNFGDYTGAVNSFTTPRVAAKSFPLKKNDILFAGSGETRTEIGKCVAYIGPTPAVAGGDIIVMRGNHYNPIYLASLANTREVVTQKTRAGQGDAIVHIYSHTLASVTLQLPSRSEQDAIAQVIVDTDSEIDLLRQRLHKAHDLKYGMMQQLLTGRTRLPPKDSAA